MAINKANHVSPFGSAGPLSNEATTTSEEDIPIDALPTRLNFSEKVEDDYRKLSPDMQSMITNARFQYERLSHDFKLRPCNKERCMWMLNYPFTPFTISDKSPVMEGKTQIVFQKKRLQSGQHYFDVAGMICTSQNTGVTLGDVAYVSTTPPSTTEHLTSNAGNASPPSIPANQKHWGKFIGDRRRELKQELEALRLPHSDRIKDSDRGLAGYLLARNSINQTISEDETTSQKDTLPNLRDGQITLTETRSIFANRRSNIADDIEASNYQVLARLHTQRELCRALVDVFDKKRKGKSLDHKEEQLLNCWPNNYVETLHNYGLPDKQIDSWIWRIAVNACGMYGQAPNCDELSSYASLSHAKRMKSDQNIWIYFINARINNETWEHQWAEILSRHAENVVIDPWTDDWKMGTTVLSEDATFSRVDKQPAFAIDDSNAGGVARDDADALLWAIKKNSMAIQFFEEALERNNANWIQKAKALVALIKLYQSIGKKKDSIEGIYGQAPSILSDEFRGNARAGMEKLKTEQRFTQLIRATGVARSLSVRVKAATKHAADNFDTASAAAAQLIGTTSSETADQRKAQSAVNALLKEGLINIIRQTPFSSHEEIFNAIKTALLLIAPQERWENTFLLWQQIEKIVQAFPETA